jgi:conjugative transposon TraJ protein
MKKRSVFFGLLAGAGILLPMLGYAQIGVTSPVSSGIQGLQATLDQVFHTMLGYDGELTQVAQGLAGFGALFYISYRVWGHLARAETIDFFPLLRPFAIGLALAFYPAIVGLFNGILQPTADATGALVTNSNAAISALLNQKQALLEQGAEWQMYVGNDGSGDKDKWAQYTGNTDNGISTGFGLTNWVKFQIAKTSYDMKNTFKIMLAQFLEILFEAAALCVNTIRIFYLVVLAIVGPLAFGLSVFNGFHHVLTAWMAKYIHIFLWLPVCNIFGSIIGQVQQQMLKIDIAQLQASGSTSFGATDAAYLVFLIMGILGYFTVPSITQNIITVFPLGGAHLAKATNVFTSATISTVTAAGDIGAAAMSGAMGGAEMGAMYKGSGAGGKAMPGQGDGPF